MFQGLAVRDRKILLPEDFRIKIKRTECGKERKRNKEKSAPLLSYPFTQNTNSMADVGKIYLVFLLLLAVLLFSHKYEVTEVRDGLHSFSKVPIHEKRASFCVLT